MTFSQELTHSAALSPVAGPSSAPSSSLRGETSRLAAAGPQEAHDRLLAPPPVREQSIEHQSGSHPSWGLEVHQRQDPLEQGYLAPPPLNYNTSNFAAMQVNTEQEEEQALSEPGSSASGGQGSVSGSNHGEDGGQEVSNQIEEQIDILLGCGFGGLQGHWEPRLCFREQGRLDEERN